MKRQKAFFDGYNTISTYDESDHFAVIRYHFDGWYCGDRRKPYAVRTGGEDLESFGTLKEARAFFRCCVKTCAESGDSKDFSDIIDDILRTWRKIAA